jgi:hypothetical protein
MKEAAALLVVASAFEVVIRPHLEGTRFVLWMTTKDRYTIYIHNITRISPPLFLISLSISLFISLSYLFHISTTYPLLYPRWQITRPLQRFPVINSLVPFSRHLELTMQ